MIEASMERFLRLDKEDFTGKAPTLQTKQRGPRMKLVYLEVENTDSDCMGNEPVYAGDRVVGVTTSGGFGHKTGKSLAFAYVPPDMTAEGTEFDVLVFQERRRARIIPESIRDPANERLRA
jgi:dimethylglycine dehydrogenase